MSNAESNQTTNRSTENKARTDRLIENYLRRIGYTGDTQLVEFMIEPDVLRNQMNSIKLKIVGNRPKMNQILQKLNPYKMTYIGSALMNLFIIVILGVILLHFLKYQNTTIGIVSVAVSIGFLTAALVQSIMNLSLPDDLFFINYVKPSIKDGHYFLTRMQVIKNIRGDKIYLIPISALLLIAFLAGITLNYPWIEYLSSWFDSLGYLFAVVYFVLRPLFVRVVGENAESKTRWAIQLVLGIIFFMLLIIRLVTNWVVLSDFFIVFEAPLYISIFGFSIYDISRLTLAS